MVKPVYRKTITHSEERYFADNEWPKTHKTLKTARKYAMKKQGSDIYKLDWDDSDYAVGGVFPKNGKWYFVEYVGGYGEEGHTWELKKDGSLGKKVR